MRTDCSARRTASANISRTDRFAEVLADCCLAATVRAGAAATTKRHMLTTRRSARSARRGREQFERSEPSRSWVSRYAYSGVCGSSRRAWPSDRRRSADLVKRPPTPQGGLIVLAPDQRSPVLASATGPGAAS